MNHWLFKTEPGAYSIADLRRDGVTHWDGIRNYQSRNFLRDQIKAGDRVLFYHSNANPPAVVGTATVSRAGYPDFTALDASDHHYDPKSTPDNPIWYMVDISFESEFSRAVGLDEIKADPLLSEMMVARRGSRLSVQPVSADHFAEIIRRGSGQSAS